MYLELGVISEIPNDTEVLNRGTNIGRSPLHYPSRPFFRPMGESWALQLQARHP